MERLLRPFLQIHLRMDCSTPLRRSADLIPVPGHPNPQRRNHHPDHYPQHLRDTDLVRRGDLLGLFLLVQAPAVQPHDRQHPDRRRRAGHCHRWLVHQDRPGRHALFNRAGRRRADVYRLFAGHHSPNPPGCSRPFSLIAHPQPFSRNGGGFPGVACGFAIDHGTSRACPTTD